MHLEKISIVIPVLNEANQLPKTLAVPIAATSVEIIVVDGGSQDQTVEIARSLGAKVIQSSPGRAKQLNVGAMAATGEILVFLHADTQLPIKFDVMIREILSQPGTIAGAFGLKIGATLSGLRWVERGVNCRSRYLQMPYGDQVLFLHAEVFHQIGGFPDLPIMEDFEFVTMLRRRGKIAIAPAAVITSGRRWQQLGILRTTIVNQIVVLAYLLGVSPARLQRWYRSGLQGKSRQAIAQIRRIH